MCALGVCCNFLGEELFGTPESSKSQGSLKFWNVLEITYLVVPLAE